MHGIFCKLGLIQRPMLVSLVSKSPLLLGRRCCCARGGFATTLSRTNAPGITRGQQTCRFQNNASRLVFCCRPQTASTSIPTPAKTAAATVVNAIFALWLHDVIVEHRVRPIRHIISMEVPKQHTFLESATAAAVGLPPGLARRPRATIARVESRDCREVSIGESSWHQGEIVRNGPDTSSKKCGGNMELMKNENVELLWETVRGGWLLQYREQSVNIDSSAHGNCVATAVWQNKCPIALPFGSTDPHSPRGK